MAFDAYSDDELQAELRRRERARLPAKPEPKAPDAIDWAPVYTMATHHINGLDGQHEECHSEDDCQDYLYEAVLQAIYGKGIWPWLRTK